MLDNSLEKRQEQALQTKALFGFARELGRVRRENVVRLDRHPWHLMLSAVDSSLPGVRKWEPGTKTPNVLLSVEQQDLPVCPAPPQEIAALVSAGWDKPEWMHPDNAPAAVDGDPRLARQWSGWLEKRREWLLAWDRASRSLDLFRQLYVQGRFIEDSNLRYVAKAGSISFASDAKRHSARHPLLTHPVNFRLNVEQGRAVISIVVDLSEHSRFESELLSSFPEDNLRFETCQPVREDVERCDPHPFDTAVVRPGFQRMAATISPVRRQPKA